MHAPVPSPAAGRRELVLVAVLLVGLSSVMDPTDAFAAAGLLPLVVLIAGVGVFGGDGAPDRPYAARLLPAVLTGAAAASVHLVPAGLWLVAALMVFAMVVDRYVALEAAILHQPGALSDGDRIRVLGAAVVTAFVAFTGVAALVPGGMPEPAGATTVPRSAEQGWLVILAATDAVAALILGWRLASLRLGQPLEVARSAATYALVVAIAAGLIRAIDLPRLVGPAVLTLVFYLWDAQHASAGARRRERGFLWEMLLLAGLAILVVAWNSRIGT